MGEHDTDLCACGHKRTAHTVLIRPDLPVSFQDCVCQVTACPCFAFRCATCGSTAWPHPAPFADEHRVLTERGIERMSRKAVLERWPPRGADAVTHREVDG